MSRPRRAAALLATVAIVLAAAASPAPAPPTPAAAITLVAPIEVRYRDAAGLTSDHAALRLSQLCDGIGHRLSGSPALERAIGAVAHLTTVAPLLAGIGATQVSPGGGAADIGPLMRRGVPGISLRTTMAHYFDWHHGEADMLDKVDPLELQRNVAAMAVLLYVLADDPAPLPRGTGAPAAAAATH